MDSAAAYVDGELVLDEGGAIAHTFSVTKPLAAMCVLMLVDRGKVDLDDEVELPAGATVRHVLSHQAGLVALREPQPLETALDWDRAIAALRAEQPWWEPGTRAGEHALWYGHLVGDIVRRVDGRTLGTFFREEIAEPLAIDFWIGLPDEYAHRLSATRPDPTVIMRLMAGDIGSLLGSGDPRYALHNYEVAFLTQLLTAPDSIPSRALDCLAPSGVAPQELANHPKLRGCELASSSGFGSADALARLAVLVAAGGSLGDVHLFSSEDTLRDAIEPASEYSTDGMMLTPVAFTQGGFGRFTDDATRTTSIGWGGAGGQMVRFVPALDLALGYVTNTLGSRMAMNDPRGLALLAAATECANG